MGRMSKIPDLIPKDAQLHNRFAFFIRLGQGGFGQVGTILFLTKFNELKLFLNIINDLIFLGLQRHGYE